MRLRVCGCRVYTVYYGAIADLRKEQRRLISCTACDLDGDN